MKRLQDEYSINCVGPGIFPDGQKCINGTNGDQWHKTTMPGYNGIINWRCPECFKTHQINVRLHHLRQTGKNLHSIAPEQK